MRRIRSRCFNYCINICISTTTNNNNKTSNNEKNSTCSIGNYKNKSNPPSLATITGEEKVCGEKPPESQRRELKAEKVSLQRPSFRREDVTERLTSTTTIGRVVALQCLLELVSKMSMSMQTVNVIPWELMAEQRQFYNKMMDMNAALREQPQ
jgi:hypothetical protein